MHSLMNQLRCGEYLPWGKYWWKKVEVKVLVAQLCPSLCDPMDCSLPGSSVHWILQARILEWVAMPSSRGSSWPRNQTHVSCISYIGRQILYHSLPLAPPGKHLHCSMCVCVCVCVCVLSHLSHVWLCVILWTIACQALLPMAFSRQEYWNGLPCPPPGDLPNPGIKPMSLTSPALAGGFFTTHATWEAFIVQ